MDELLELYTDTKPSVAQIIQGQLHAPFSLEPPAFHLLLHGFHHFLHHPKLAARLPSILALLGTEACTFFLAWRASGRRAVAFVAMLLPLALVTVDYAPESRVYGLLTACLAASLLCWQIAASSAKHRGSAIAGLCVIMSFTTLLHYYAIFLVFPLWSAEAFRSLRRRKLDVGIVAALAIGTAAVVLDLPFQRALAPFRLHYYNTGETDWSNIGFTYHWFVTHFQIYREFQGPRLNGDIEALLLVAFLVVCSVLRIVPRRHVSAERAALEVGLCVTALLPAINLIAAQFTRAYVPRYSLPAVVGLSVLFALTLAELCPNAAAQVLFAVVLAFAGENYLYQQIDTARREEDHLGGISDLSPEQRLLIAKSPDPHVYIQDVAQFLVHHFYAPADTQQTLRGLYSIPCELFWRHRDPASLFARNMEETANLPFERFRELVQEGGPHYLIVDHDPNEEWINLELEAEHASVQYLGPALGGDLLKVTFSHQPTCGG